MGIQALGAVLVVGSLGDGDQRGGECVAVVGFGAAVQLGLDPVERVLRVGGVGDGGEGLSGRAAVHEDVPAGDAAGREAGRSVGVGSVDPDPVVGGFRVGLRVGALVERE